VRRRSYKSIAHLQIQLHLKTLISSLTLEKPFPSIGRIADAVWEDKKIIFEVQCSPISLQEAEERTADYCLAGYTTIWLLHDRKFNGWRAGPAELFFRSQLSFFINGKFIYDQKEVFRGTFRIFKGPPVLMDPRHMLQRKCRTITLKTRRPSLLQIYRRLLSPFLEKISS
jgi:competence protein CoiA